MPVERQRWATASTLDQVNARLRRCIEVLDTSDRAAVLTVNASATVALTYPQTMGESDTTAGAVAVTLPSAATVPGFRVEWVKVAGANALTVNGVSVATFAAFRSSGAAWRQVG